MEDELRDTLIYINSFLTTFFGASSSTQSELWFVYLGTNGNAALMKQFANDVVHR